MVWDESHPLNLHGWWHRPRIPRRGRRCAAAVLRHLDVWRPAAMLVRDRSSSTHNMLIGWDEVGNSSFVDERE